MLIKVTRLYLCDLMRRRITEALWVMRRGAGTQLYSVYIHCLLCVLVCGSFLSAVDGFYVGVPGYNEGGDSGGEIVDYLQQQQS